MCVCYKEHKKGRKRKAWLMGDNYLPRIPLGSFLFLNPGLFTELHFCGPQRKISKYDLNMTLKSHGITIFSWIRVRPSKMKKHSSFNVFSRFYLLIDGSLFVWFKKILWWVNCQHWHNSRLLWGWIQINDQAGAFNSINKKKKIRKMDKWF